LEGWHWGNINIWNDPWIPSSQSRKIISPRGDAVLTKVSELISPITCMWDEQLISDLLNPLDASRVLQIPINNEGFDDIISWHFTKHGRYMVR
jgi:hypothetical protein